MNITEDKLEIYNILKSYVHNFENAEEELELFINTAIQNNDYTFSTGLIGAGWLLSFLHQQEIIQDDIDELLYDFDDNFYKIAVKFIVNDSSSLNDLLNIITYYQQRIQNKSNAYNFHRRFPLYETIKLLTEKLISKLGVDDLSIQDKVKCMLKLSYLSITCINEKEIEEVYYRTTENLIDYYSNLASPWSEKDEISAQILILASIQFDHPIWVEKLKEIFSKINSNYFEKSIVFNNVNRKLGESKEIKLTPMDLQNCMDEKTFYQIISNVKRIELKIGKY